MDKYETKFTIMIFAHIFLLIGGLILGYLFLMSVLNVYRMGKYGEAELAQAESNRKIKIRESEAIKESSICLAEAEVIRAKGVAEANKIIGDSLKGNEAYLRYRWIEGLQTNQMQTIYVPTEAGLPILEANPNIRK